MRVFVFASLSDINIVSATGDGKYPGFSMVPDDSLDSTTKVTVPGLRKAWAVSSNGSQDLGTWSDVCGKGKSGGQN